MLLIVSHHYVVSSDLMNSICENPISSASIFYYLFGAWGKTGINCFVLITGYFMCESAISLRKFLKLYVWIVFYNIAITSIFTITGYVTLSLNAIFLFMPFRIIHSNCFGDAFMVWWLFIPFLNILIKNLSRKMHMRLLVMLFIVFSVYPFVPKILQIDNNPICWFSTLYVIASYIRKYPQNIPYGTSALFWGCITIILVMIVMASIYSILMLGSYLDLELPQWYLIAESHQLFALFIALASFMWFKNIKINNNRVINTIAASSFGVLLIHANSDTMRQWLWKDTIDSVGHYDTPYYWLYAIGCVLAIYAVCTVIDIIRIKTIETPLLNATETLCLKIYNKFKR